MLDAISPIKYEGTRDGVGCGGGRIISQKVKNLLIKPGHS